MAGSRIDTKSGYCGKCTVLSTTSPRAGLFPSGRRSQFHMQFFERLRGQILQEVHVGSEDWDHGLLFFANSLVSTSHSHMRCGQSPAALVESGRNPNPCPALL